MEKQTAPLTVDAYIAAQPGEHQAALELMRATITAAAPLAEEVISYQMPAYRHHGMLVYFGAFKNHYSFFPGNSKMIAQQFAEELAGYDVSKGTIRLSYNKPVPTELIEKIVKQRLLQNDLKNLKAPGKAKK